MYLTKEEYYPLDENGFIITKMSGALLLVLIFCLLSSCNKNHDDDMILSGFWTPKKYVMSTGESQDVSGHISFGRNQWSVVFFVLDADGNPISASAEGGEYALKQDNLTFWHSYNFSDIQKENSGSLTKTIHNDDQRPKEFCHIEVEEDTLVIYFPSGNAMIFSKSI